MLDLKSVRENLKEVAAALNRRGPNTFSIEEFEQKDLARRGALKMIEDYKSQKNEKSKFFGVLMKTGENKDKIDGLKAEIKSLDDLIKGLEEKAKSSDEALYDLLKRTPNMPEASVPDGASAEDNKVVKTWGTPPTFSFMPKPHWEIGEALGLFDFERAAKITGARFTVYKGLGARLERALIQFMLDTQTQKHGYTEVWTPLMVNAESLFGTGNLPKFEQDLFKVQTRVPKTELHEVWLDLAKSVSKNFGAKEPVENKTLDLEKVKFFLDEYARLMSNEDSYFLIPTAEVPVTNLHRAETLEESQLPIKYAAYTPCFRSEAGAYGKDTRGMVRQHQFNKVELVKFTTAEQSEAEHEALTRDAETILEMLELPYKRVLLCAGDMGFGAAKCYDLEVYSAGQEKKWWECSSCSNFKDFQARRAEIRVKRKDGKKELAHTINGSGLATSRVLPAILENNQQADGSVVIPKVLRPYLGGLDVIKK